MIDGVAHLFSTSQIGAWIVVVVGIYFILHPIALICDFLMYREDWAVDLLVLVYSVVSDIHQDHIRTVNI